MMGSHRFTAHFDGYLLDSFSLMTIR